MSSGPVDPMDIARMVEYHNMAECNMELRRTVAQLEQTVRSLDQFHVEVEFALGETARVTDPCYSVGTWCAGEVAVHPGRWRAAVDYCDGGDGWGKRVRQLLAWNIELVPGRMWAADARDQVPFEVGVDSGCAGIFDAQRYAQEYQDGKSFGDSVMYHAAKEMHKGELQFAPVLGFGVVSCAGYGDGGYTAYVHRTEGVVQALRIEFITSDERDADGRDGVEEVAS